MKILLTGSKGQVGKAIVEAAKRFPVELIAFDHASLDITDKEILEKNVDNLQPQVIINAAAYTAVDKAEAEKEKAFAVNALGALHLAKISAQTGIPLIHLSTDYIFDGEKTSPYVEEDTANPLNVYGLSKWQGETYIREYGDKYLILRVSWVFSEYGHNFVKSMLKLMKAQEVLRIVADQTGCPTYAGDIAEVLLAVLQMPFKQGVYHYTGEPPVTWFEFAQHIYHEASKRQKLCTKTIYPIKTQDYPTPARRPRNSILESSLFTQTFHLPLQSWQKGLKKIVEKISLETDDNA